MPQKRRRGRNVDPDVMAQIEALWLEEWSPSQTLAALERDERFADRSLPSLRSVSRIFTEDLGPRDPSGAWRFTDATTEAADVVLEVLMVVIERTSGRVNQLTNDEAKWILKLHRVAPLLSPWMVYATTRAYLVRQAREATTEDLDAFVAAFSATGWSDPLPFERYLLRLVPEGLVPPAPLLQAEWQAEVAGGAPEGYREIDYIDEAVYDFAQRQKAQRRALHGNTEEEADDE